VRLANGKIVEHWNCVDRLGLLVQLGALPQMAEASAQVEFGHPLDRWWQNSVFCERYRAFMRVVDLSRLSRVK